MPKYNILLRDDKSLQYIRIDIKSDYPTVTMVRRPLDDKAEYFGPYISGFAVKKALRILRKAFPFASSKPNAKRASLYYHLGLDPGLEEGKTTLISYRANLRNLMRYIRGERETIMRIMEKEMKLYAKKQDFEKATIIRNRLHALQQLNRQILFSDREFLDISKDKGLSGLVELLQLPKPLKRIECFDISHQQGTDTVASMVVFGHGLPDKANYRKFKMRLPGNDDFAHMREVIKRRLSEKNVKDWGLPDLIIIDGGKGQLSSALEARAEAGLDIPMIGLAKKEETIVIQKQMSVSNFGVESMMARAKEQQAYVQDSDDFLMVLLPKQSDIVKLLQRIRDETHRFAISYHTTLKRTRQTKSLLDDVPGVGVKTKQKLLRHFGSLRGVTAADQAEISVIVGQRAAQNIYSYLHQ